MWSVKDQTRRTKCWCNALAIGGATRCTLTNGRLHPVTWRVLRMKQTPQASLQTYINKDITLPSGSGRAQHQRIRLRVRYVVVECSDASQQAGTKRPTQHNSRLKTHSATCCHVQPQHRKLHTFSSKNRHLLRLDFGLGPSTACQVEGWLHHPPILTNCP